MRIILYIFLAVLLALFAKDCGDRYKDKIIKQQNERILELKGEMEMYKEKLVKQLITHEGFRSKMYTDTTGHRTIGIGFNLDRKDAKDVIEEVLPEVSFSGLLTREEGLTIEQAIKLLEFDLAEIEEDARDLVENYDELNDVRQRVVCDMIFNLGKRGFSKFKRTINHIKNGDWKKAKRGMRNSLWAKQVKGRAVKLATMMETGWEDENS